MRLAKRTVFREIERLCYITAVDIISSVNIYATSLRPYFKAPKSGPAASIYLAITKYSKERLRSNVN